MKILLPPPGFDDALYVKTRLEAESLSSCELEDRIHFIQMMMRAFTRHASLQRSAMSLFVYREILSERAKKPGEHLT